MNCKCGGRYQKNTKAKHFKTLKHCKWEKLQTIPVASTQSLKPPTKLNLTFAKQLGRLNFPPLYFLKEARNNAIKYGYDPELLQFSDKDCYKLLYDSKYYFGTVNFPDAIINNFLGVKSNPTINCSNNIVNELNRRILWDCD